MNRKTFETYLADYLEGELGERETEELMAYLERDEAARAEFQAYQEQEALLGQYYRGRLERALNAPNPIEEDGVVQVRGRGFEQRRRWPLYAAAAALLAVGLAGLWAYRLNAPLGNAVLAEIKEAHGRIAIRDGGKFAAAQEGDVLRQARRVKVAGGGYLAVDLGEGNVLEARSGTQFEIQDFPNRTEVVMNRGQIWVHLTTPPAKRFVVRTEHLTATAIGTVFGVEEGLDRSIVRVAEGKVEVERKRKRRRLRVARGESYSTREDAPLTPLFDAIGWSRYPERLVALAATAEAGDGAEFSPLVVESGAIVSPTLTIPTTAEEPTPIADLTDLLPEDTRYMLDMRDWPGLLDEFRSSDYKEFFDQPEVREWWESIRGREMVDGFLREFHLLEILDIARLVDGQLVMGVTPDHQFLFVADCLGHEDEVRELIEKILGGSGAEAPSEVDEDFLATGARRDLIQDLLREQALEIDGWEDSLRGHVRIERGRLIVSSSPSLVDETAARVRSGEPTGFGETDFRKRVSEGANDARFLIAADLAGLIEEMTSEADSHEANWLNFLGVPGLETLILSPRFESRGMAQSARLSFKEERYGAMDWLAEPAPMRGLDFFSPDVHFFASAIVRSPREMFFDYLFLLKAEGEEASYDEALAFFDEHEVFFDALGGEVTIGLENPILPIANVKIALEVADPSGFEEHLTKVLDDLLEQLESEQDVAANIEESEYKGYRIRSIVVDGQPFGFEPTYAFVDDYLVLGPGAQFVRDSIDVYDSGNSIAHSSRLLDLLPASNQLDYSLLVYQDIARSIPKFLESGPMKALGDGALDFLPDVGFLEDYRAPGVAYAFAHRSHVDLYLNATGGIDFNIGMAAPMVARWLTPRLDVGP